MKGRKGFTLIELLVVIAIIAILAAILFPVFAKARKTAQNSTCQSNMKQIGTAIKTYLSNWDDTFPTNRDSSVNSQTTTAAAPSIVVQLSADPNGQNNNGTSTIFDHGTNWVEALYKYVDSGTKQTDNSTAWKCPAASDLIASPAGTGSTTAMVTYVINYNLLEQPEGIIKSSANLMLVREADRMVEAVAVGSASSGKATVGAYATSTAAPCESFLTGSASTYSGFSGSTSSINYKMHGNGSNVLFADGHVKAFQSDYFTKVGDPNQSSAEWNNTLSQWFNFSSTQNDSVPKNHYDSIALTP